MPVNIRTTDMKYKDSQGNYVGINGVAERTTAEMVADVEAAGADTIADVQQAVAASQAALDGIDAQRNTMIAAIASVAGQGTDTTFTQAGVAADAAEVGKLKSAIKQEQISSFAGSFDASLFESGYINLNLSVGEQCNYDAVVSNAGFVHIVVFGIKPGETFTITGKGTQSANLWGWLDSTGKVLELGIYGSTKTNLIITAPTTASILVCNFNASIPHALKRNLNTYDLNTDVQSLDANVQSDALDTDWNIAMLYRYSTNLLDRTKETSGYYVDVSTGELVANATYSVSDWIAIAPSTNYLVTQTISGSSRKSGLRVVIYDINRNRLDGVLETRQVPVNANAYWMRVSYQSSADTMQVEKGTSATAYVPYNKQPPSTYGMPQIIYPDHGQTEYGENQAYAVEDDSQNWTLVNATYVEDFIDNHGDPHDGYLIETPLVSDEYQEAYISASYPVVEGQDYFVGAFIPYVNNPPEGGRVHLNYKLTFGNQSHIAFGNNDGNFSQIFTASDTETITIKIGSVPGEYWKAQVVTFYLLPITNYRTSSITIVPHKNNPKTLIAERTGFAMGGGHSKLFNDVVPFDFGSRQALNNKPSMGNTAFGDGAQTRLTTGFYNTAFGYQAQAYLTTGSFNVALGRSAQSEMTAGQFNIGIGQVAQHAITTGSWNVAIGNETQRDLAEGDNNVSIGRRVHNSMEEGSGNTCVGSRASFYPNATIKGNDQTLIGMEACPSADTVNDSIAPTAIGAYSKAGNYAFAAGANANAGYSGSVAIGTDNSGNGATSSAINEIAIGTANHSIKLAGHTIVFNQDGTVSWS